MKGPPATVYEVMAGVIARELNDRELWFLGMSTGPETILMLTRIPIAAMALAQRTHAPNSWMLVAGWVMNPDVSKAPTSMESEFGTTLGEWPSEAYNNSLAMSYVAARHEIDVGFGSAAQVDKYGNCNTVAIGDYARPKVRLVGPINQPGHFSLFGREIIIMPQERRNFVDRVDFISGAGYLDGPGSRERSGLYRGGPVMILTDKAVFRFADESKFATLASVHPGHTVDDVTAETGFTHDYVPSHVPETPAPSAEELRLIREDIDPRGVMLPR
ncbi:MAG: CoA-transferase [Chloroflexota bacterium]